MATEKKNTKTAVKSAEKGSTAVATSAVNFEDDAGAGQENMDKDDFTIPRLSILQTLSPQVKKKDDAYIDGAEEGMVLDSVSGTVIDGEVGLLVVPVSYRRAYIEWKLREDGGGFVADHGNDSSVLNGTTKDDKNRDCTGKGTNIVTTSEYFVFIIDPETGAFSPAVISMSSTQLKKAKRWNTMINQLRLEKADGSGTFNPAMFYRSYMMTTTPESNASGDWFGWKIAGADNTVDLPGGSEIYMEAKKFREQISSGDVKVQEHSSEGDVEENDDDPM